MSLFSGCHIQYDYVCPLCESVFLQKKWPRGEIESQIAPQCRLKYNTNREQSNTNARKVFFFSWNTLCIKISDHCIWGTPSDVTVAIVCSVCFIFRHSLRDIAIRPISKSFYTRGAIQPSSLSIETSVSTNISLCLGESPVLRLQL